MPTPPDAEFKLREHLAPLALILALCFLAAIPVFRFGMPFGMDATEHLSWYRCFADQLRGGELYPQWLQGMNGGLGSPDLYVYGPLPYYAAAIFHAFTGPGREVWDLGLSVVLAMALAGVTAYFWLRQLAAGRLIPAAGAVVYLAVPYYLKTDLYTRVALAEFWAFAWMPLILWCTAVLVQRRSPAALAGLGLGWGLLFVTHLFTAMLFAPLALLYAVWMAAPRQRVQLLLTAGCGMLLGAALAAFYLVPALSYEKYISAYKLIQTRPDYRFERNFLFSGVAPTPYLNGLSRFTAWTLLVAALFAASAFMTRSARMIRETLWWAAVAVVSFVLMLPVSTWFWGHAPLLGAIQFPSRLNTLLTVATAGLAAMGMESLRRRWQWSKAVLVGLALLLALGWVRPLFFTMGYQQGQMQRLGTVNLDYLITAWAQWTDPRMISMRGLADAPSARLVSPVGTATEVKWQPKTIEFHTDNASETWVTIRQFYFPIWTAETAQGMALKVRPSSPEGLLSVQVPAGAADIRVRQARGVPQLVGVALSGLAAIGLIILGGRRQLFAAPTSAAQASG